jgi:hypothetical protein
MTTTLRRQILAVLLISAAAAGVRAQCPLATNPHTPANGIVTTETRIEFKWDPAGSGVTGYDLMLAKDGAAPVIACLNSPAPNCTLVLTPARYEWFVRSWNTNAGCSTDSRHMSLQIDGCSAPTAPGVLVPDNGVTSASVVVTLSWSGGSADNWDVFLEPGSSCTTTTPSNATPLTATSYAPGALVRGATYAWRVRANRGSTCPAPVLSHCATFTVRSCDPPSQPVPTLPSDGAAGQPSVVNLAWTASAGATLYNVWTKSGSDAFTLAGTTTGISLNAAFRPGVSVEWFVDAISGSCLTSSRHQTFTTAACGGAAPVPLSPTGTITAGAPIVFRWSAVASAQRYRLWLAPAGGTFASIEDTSDLTFTAHRPAGAYDWFVEAIRSDCAPVRSAVTRFIVPQPESCPSSAATPLTPPNGASATGTIAFTWTAVAGAARYEVWASVDDTSPALVGSTTGTTLNTDLAPGRIRWYVIAHFDGCADVASATSTFDVTRSPACAGNAVPLLTGPADDAQQVPTTVDFFWTSVPGFQDYRVWVAVDDAPATVVATTTELRARATVPRGRVRWFVETTFAGCGSRRTPSASFRTNAPTGCSIAAPEASAPGGAPSGGTYEIRWTPLANIDHYEVLESTAATAASPTVFKIADVTLPLHHEVTTATRYLYRVRAVSNCGAGTGPLSPEIAVTVSPTSEVVPFGRTTSLNRSYFVPGRGAATPFTATSDRPWLTIAPSSGTLPPEGITLTLTIDPRTLDAGDSVATIRIDTPSGKLQGNATTTTAPVSVKLVTPVTPGGKEPAASSSLILPAVAHLDGATAFRSDVRLANTSAQPIRYQLTFTPTATDATVTAQQTFVQVDAGATIALNDLLQSFFNAAPGASSSGSLEIKPLAATADTSAPPNVSFASSRTFSVTPAGTSGQFIPAIPLSRFAGNGTTLLVPQVSQAGAFRTNVGLVEASTQPAHAVLSFFDALGNRLSQVPVDLLPGEHRQLNGMVTSAGNLANAVRMEVNVTSATGLVTAYASVLDQTTSDPMLVDAVPLGAAGAKRYVVPGVATLDAGSGNRWRSDMRVFNAGASPQAATLIFTPQGGGTQSVPITLAAGEVRSLDDVLHTTFGADNAGGSVAVTTSQTSKLAVTARTYFDTGSGTFGQYIPAFTESGGSGTGERALQILQVEQSEKFRTNLGLVELAGQAATVEIKALIPELKVSPTISIELQPNQFVQYGSILAQLGYPTVYNSRLSVRVTAGSGRVAGYGCLIDSASGDPTYIPSQ